MAYEKISYELNGSIAIIKFNDPLSCAEAK